MVGTSFVETIRCLRSLTLSKTMEGNHKISLTPPATGTVDGYGERVGRVYRAADAKEFWATRIDLGGREPLMSARFAIRQIGAEALTVAWQLVDAQGRIFDIESISEPPWTRGRSWWIYAVSRTSLGRTQ